MTDGVIHSGYCTPDDDRSSSPVSSILVATDFLQRTDEKKSPLMILEDIPIRLIKIATIWYNLVLKTIYV